MDVDFIRFIDVPVGAVFTTENGMRFMKIRDIAPIDYLVSPLKVSPNCADLDDNLVHFDDSHEFGMSPLTKCYNVQFQQH